VLTFTDSRIEQAILKTNAKLMIFDILTAYLGSANISNASGTRPAFKHLARVAERTDCSFIFIGHLTKRGGSNALYRGLGSIDIAASARSILTVGRLKENERAFTHTKSNLSASGQPAVIFTWRIWQIFVEWRVQCYA
jgi:RecA-family ATPase